MIHFENNFRSMSFTSLEQTIQLKTSQNIMLVPGNFLQVFQFWNFNVKIDFQPFSQTGWTVKKDFTGYGVD